MIQYDPHKWFDHFFDIQGSMFREIMGRVAACVLWCVAVVIWHLNVQPLGAPPTIHSLVGVALGLLLVFRTNASYDRFWEGRKLWGGIVNETRNLWRASGVYLTARPDIHSELARWTVAFAYASMHSLRGKRDIGPVARLLPARKVEMVLAAQHVPLAVASEMSRMLGEARQLGLISDYIQATLDNNVQLLIDYLGGCERIHKTPLPFAYMIHLRRALVLYTFTLPFALISTFGAWTILDVFMISYIFFGIEEIGVEIEDPFEERGNDLPLEAICGTIEANLLPPAEVAAG